MNLNSVYDKMLAHCAEYLDSVGDHPLNLASTGLAVNAYLLTGEKKYRDWILEYVGAWKQRTDANGGNIPTNIGRDGKVGGEYGGRWYKGTYGWNFTIYDGEIDQIAHRNTFSAGSWPGFANAYLVSGDPGFLATLRKQMDNLYAQKKVINGREMIPQMFGDPRGYKETGREEWYQWTPNLHTDLLAAIYMWSGDPKDLERVPKTGLVRLPGGERAAVSRAGAASRPRVRATQSKGTAGGPDVARYPACRLSDVTESGRAQRLGEPHDGRASHRQHLVAARAAALLRPGAAPERLA